MKYRVAGDGVRDTWDTRLSKILYFIVGKLPCPLGTTGGHGLICSSDLSGFVYIMKGSVICCAKNRL